MLLTELSIQVWANRVCQGVSLGWLSVDRNGLPTRDAGFHRKDLLFRREERGEVCLRAHQSPRLVRRSHVEQVFPGRYSLLKVSYSEVRTLTNSEIRSFRKHPLYQTIPFKWTLDTCMFRWPSDRSVSWSTIPVCNVAGRPLVSVGPNPRANICPRPVSLFC